MLSAISIKKVHSATPRLEIKRRARAGDEFSGLLYKAAAYGNSLKVLLWAIIGTSAAGFFVIIGGSMPGWLALLLSLAVIWLGFAWLPNTRTGFIGKNAARYLTPPLAWLLGRLYPALSGVDRRASKYIKDKSHTGLYQREDLLNLLESQKSQPDNRIGGDELKIVAGALTFGDKLVRDVMTPKRAVKTVAATDEIGPHLMDELHASGHSRYPVYQDKKDNLVGVLYLHDLLAVSDGGQVREVMSKKLFYAHEEQTLNQVLKAFLKTKHHMHIVVNEFEEVVGVVTIEDVLEQILGSPIIDEFDKYDDLRAVAALKAKTEHKQHIIKEKQSSTDQVGKKE